MSLTLQLQILSGEKLHDDGNTLIPPQQFLSHYAIRIPQSAHCKKLIIASLLLYKALFELQQESSYNHLLFVNNFM